MLLKKVLHHLSVLICEINTPFLDLNLSELNLQNGVKSVSEPFDLQMLKKVLVI